jgi:hypothetical protein
MFRNHTAFLCLYVINREPVFAGPAGFAFTAESHFPRLLGAFVFLQRLPIFIWLCPPSGGKSDDEQGIEAPAAD